VSLSFSLDPDRDSVERRFSLNRDDGRVKGNFNWDGRTVTFVPSAPLEKNYDYNLSLSAEARDKRGLSMDSAFERKFTTRPGAERPVLISYSPPLYAQVEDLKTEVRLSFSLPVRISALYDSVSFYPSMSGIWRLEKGGRLAVFTPSLPWANNKRYEIRYSTSLIDVKGMSVGKEFKSVFTTGTDKNPPFLSGAYRASKSGRLTPLERDTGGFTGAAEKFSENGGWEKDDRLSLVFSRPVDSASVKNCLNVEDAPSFSMETAPGFNDEFVFYFENAPVYESRFAVKIKPGVKDGAGNESADEYVYRVFADGEFSKPPRFVGMRMPMSPENNADLAYFDIEEIFQDIRISDENYPSGVEVKTWVELYFEAARGASVDVFSVMELFRVESANGALSFLPQRVKTGNFTVPKPKEGWEKYERVEIAGTLKNSIYFGIVNFQINSGLKDSLGNTSEKTFRISTVK